jgi:hypothetical protein
VYDPGAAVLAAIQHAADCEFPQQKTVSIPKRVSLEFGCCADTDESLFLQMSAGKYQDCAVLPLPGSLEEWRAEHKTARKRADRAYSRGYVADVLPRERYADDIHAINTSASHRQGRPMSPGYRTRTEFAPLAAYRCPRHAVRVTGVWAPDGHVVAYLVMLRQGDLALVSQILGHADHLEREVMWLLFEHALAREIKAGPDGFVVYNRHDSGTDGLRWWKERVGFREARVGWLP